MNILEIYEAIRDYSKCPFAFLYLLFLSLCVYISMCPIYLQALTPTNNHTHTGTGIIVAADKMIPSVNRLKEVLEDWDAEDDEMEPTVSPSRR